MTATVVRVDDLDAPAASPIRTALANLADLHHLPPYVKAYPTATGVALAVTPDTADQWRAALGAPPYARRENQHYTGFKTEVLWFGISVRLQYADY